MRIIKRCKHKIENNICNLSKQLQFLSGLSDDDMICNLKEDQLKLCPAFEEKEINIKLVK